MWVRSVSWITYRHGLKRPAHSDVSRYMIPVRTGCISAECSSLHRRTRDVTSRLQPGVPPQLCLSASAGSGRLYPFDVFLNIVGPISSPRSTATCLFADSSFGAAAQIPNPPYSQCLPTHCWALEFSRSIAWRVSSSVPACGLLLVWKACCFHVLTLHRRGPPARHALWQLFVSSSVSFLLCFALFRNLFGFYVLHYGWTGSYQIQWPAPALPFLFALALRSGAVASCAGSLRVVPRESCWKKKCRGSPDCAGSRVGLLCRWLTGVVQMNMATW